MLSIHKFCTDRLISKKIEEAFQAYCKASLSEYFDIRASDTLSKIIVKLKDEQVEELWKKFVIDLKDLLTTQEKFP